MSLLAAFAGAMVITYWVSRGLLKLLARGLRGTPLLLAAHAASLAIIALLVGILKAYGQMYRADVALIYVVPQLVWLVLDVIRTRPIAVRG